MRVLPAEALYGFAAWITSRKEPVTASCQHDAAIWAELVNEYCKANGFDDPRDRTYPDNLVMPDTTPQER